VSAVQDAADRGQLRAGTDAGGAAVAAWSSVHGLSSLILEGSLGIRPEQRQRTRQLAAHVVDLALAGLRRPPGGPQTR
jgi:hypothetical protein